MEFKPKKTSEANIQAEFYKQCVEAGLQCFLEYKQRGQAGQRGCRFDAVIHKEGQIIAIIEVKNPMRPSKYDWSKTNQYKRYHSYGIPVFLIKGMADIPGTIAKLRG